jgi:hypothetical protein
MPKEKLNLMGTKWDLAYRIANFRTYLYDAVSNARMAIYKAGMSITGKWVEDILFKTSSVPTMVCLVSSFPLFV